MTQDPAEDHIADARIHRALSSPVRSQIVDVLRVGEAAQDVQMLADHLGLHVNTVRAHLTLLENAGLVASEPEERDRPGRPRLVYRATGAADDLGEGAGYRFLAQILAGHLAATATDPSQAAEQAGAAWGHFLVRRPPPFSSITPDEAIEHIVGLLTDFGFLPELDDQAPDAPRILLRRCPFLDVARDHPEVVCSIHLGLMRGALDELGAAVEATDLLPFVAPNLCVSHLQLTV